MNCTRGMRLYRRRIEENDAFCLCIRYMCVFLSLYDYPWYTAYVPLLTALTYAPTAIIVQPKT